MASPAYGLRDAIVAALGAVPGVRRVASFGSVAVDNADAWSDLDLLVVSADLERTAWLAADAIRGAKRVRFYRMFTGVEQPSGRYWFWDESPFTLLDVSFLTQEAFEAELRDGVKGHAVRARTEYEVRGALETFAPVADASERLAISPSETEAGRLLYVHLEAVKAARRGVEGKSDVSQTREALRQQFAVTGWMAGGDFKGLALEALKL